MELERPTNPQNLSKQMQPQLATASLPTEEVEVSEAAGTLAQVCTKKVQPVKVEVSEALGTLAQDSTLACTKKVQPVKSTAVQRDRQKPTITPRKSAAVEPVKSLVAQSSLSRANASKLVDSNTEPKQEEVNTNAQAEKDKFELCGWIKRP